MNWQAIQNYVRQAVSAALNCPLNNVWWEGEPEAGAYLPVLNLPIFGNPEHEEFAVHLKLLSVDALGIDFLEPGIAETAEPNDVLYGNRTFRVQVKIICDNQRPGKESVGSLSARLRSRLRFATARDLLRDGQLAISDILPTFNADVWADDRQSSVGITEILMLAAEADTDTMSDGGYFDHVEVASETLIDPSGDPAVPQIELEIP